MIASNYLEIKENYQRVLEKIEKASIRSGRDPKDVQLVVVSKYQSVEIIQAAIEAGATKFGENYPELALPKIEELNHNHNIEWHMIGHLQSRKAKFVTDHFSLIHSMDSLKLADKLNMILESQNKQLRVLLEVNLAGELSKGGWPAWDNKSWQRIKEEMEIIIAMPGLHVEGLMTMPPLTADPEDSRTEFVKLRKFQEFLMKETNEQYWRDLSIGTSHDYEVAIEEGARYVRIGQAILGIRNKIR